MFFGAVLGNIFSLMIFASYQLVWPLSLPMFMPLMMFFLASGNDRLDLRSLSLRAEFIQLDELNPSSWTLNAKEPNLTIEIRNGNKRFEKKSDGLNY